MNDADWKHSLETFEIAFLEYAPGARRNIIQLFPQVPDKQKAWEDLVTLTAKMVINEDYRVARCMPLILSSAFPLVPDKEKAWLEIIRLVNFKDSKVETKIKNSMFSIFSNSLKKEEAWADLLQLTGNSNKNNLQTATNILCSYAVRSEDKQKAWDVLIKLTNSDEIEVKRIAVGSLNNIFPSIDNKHKAWEDLIKLIDDKDIQVRRTASNVVSSNFSLAPDKQKGWQDLVEIISKDDQVRKVAAGALKSAISIVNNKEKAWEDLLELTAHKDIGVRNQVSFALISAFGLLPEKQKLSQDLYKCMRNKDRKVKETVIPVLSFVYSQLPNQQQIWEELTELTNDEDIGVRRSAYYSLGKISIFKASQAENEIAYRKEFEQAIEFFEKTSKESTIFNPSQFCLPFYRSLYTIISDENKQVKNEVDKYLTEAKAAIKNSKNKQMLLEAVDNLAKALKEVQSLENKSLESKKDELSLYMRYCEQAVDLMTETEQISPYATEVLRKGLPILDRKLKLLLKEIQEKAKTACQESQGTVTEEIACNVNKKVQGWKAGTEEEIARDAEELFLYMKSNIPRFLENEHILEKIKEIENGKDLNLLLQSIPALFEELPKIMIDPERMKPTIGIITALSKEYAAVSILLENINDNYKVPGSGAGRIYCLGEIFSEEGNKHNIVLANAGMGNNIAATKATLLLEHFQNVKSIIMVGIAGGVPNPDKVDDHVRLGDIVVSNEYGVIQYDNIKKETQRIIFRNLPRPPCASLLEATRILETGELLGKRPWEKYIDQALSNFSKLSESEIMRPYEDKDILYCTDNQEEIIEHPRDPKRRKGQPRVFIGPIASANRLQKDPKERDELREKFGVKAIEMEASGIADATWNHEIGYLVVRGICDYCDSHKNDEWQQYAAVVAAAYTRALIESMP